VLKFKAMEVDSLSDLASTAVEIASEYLGLYSSMEHKLGELVALTTEDVSSSFYLRGDFTYFISACIAGSD